MFKFQLIAVFLTVHIGVLGSSCQEPVREITRQEADLISATVMVCKTHPKLKQVLGLTTGQEVQLKNSLTEYSKAARSVRSDDSKASQEYALLYVGVETRVGEILLPFQLTILEKLAVVRILSSDNYQSKLPKNSIASSRFAAGILLLNNRQKAKVKRIRSDYPANRPRESPSCLKN